MITHRQLEEATEYVNCGIKEGYFNEEDFEYLSDEEFVLKANKLRDMGDASEEGDL